MLGESALVVLHIAHIDPSVVGGVQVAVPQMVAAQMKCADAALLNTAGVAIDGVKTLVFDGEFDLQRLEKPFDKPDVVIFHELYRIAFIKIYKNIKKAGVPYVIIPHGGLNRCAQHTKRLKKTVANFLLFNGYFKASAAIQYLSDAEAASSILKKACFVCGNGVRIPDVRKERFFENGISFLYIGRFAVVFKGLDMLLEAIAAQREELTRTGCRFYLYGPDDADKAFVAGLARDMHLEELVFIGDGVFGEQKRETLLRADYFIQPSRSEGLPMGVLEALGYGVPCLVTQGTGLAGCIEENGAGFAAPSDVEGVEDLLRKAIDKKGEITRLSQNARCLAKAKFDVDLLAAAAVKEYESIVSKIKDKRC